MIGWRSQWAKDWAGLKLRSLVSKFSALSTHHVDNIKMTDWGLLGRDVFSEIFTTPAEFLEFLAKNMDNEWVPSGHWKMKTHPPWKMQFLSNNNTHKLLTLRRHSSLCFTCIHLLNCRSTYKGGTFLNLNLRLLVRKLRFRVITFPEVIQLLHGRTGLLKGLWSAPLHDMASFKGKSYTLFRAQ